MKGRESGMPEEGMWGGFFKPGTVLEVLGLDDRIQDVAEFGSGYGTFTIPAAQKVQGTVYAFDIEPEMINLTKTKAMNLGLKNVETVLHDFLMEKTDLQDESVDYVMLFNILHLENPQKLLHEAYRILRKEGKLGIIHWNYDPSTPRGPSMEIRVKPEECIRWAFASGFEQPEQHDLRPYHYGIVMRKQN